MSMLTHTQLVLTFVHRNWENDGGRGQMCLYWIFEMPTYRFLWLFQTVIFKEQRYCLTWMRFGLNLTPVIMTCRNYIFKRSIYSVHDINDVYINEDILPVVHVRQNAVIGVDMQGPGMVRVLSLQVWGEHRILHWKCGSKVPEVSDVVQHVFDVQETSKTLFYVHLSSSCDHFHKTYSHSLGVMK